MGDTLLVLDDEASIRRAIVKAFPDDTVLEAATCAEGLTKAQDGFPDLAIIDQQLPDGSGVELITALRAIDPELPIIILTGYGSGELASAAFKAGACDYLEKPFQLDRLRLTVAHLLERQQLGRQIAHLKGKGQGKSKMLAESPGMKRVTALVKKVAAVPSTTVLIMGESGVGKELVARGIHERSSRSGKKFIAINCAALSEHLLEAELFGYEKGAFTGADSKGKAGLFEAADGGTMFLDEVGEMPLTLQTKLLRVLQERRFRRVGGLEDIEVDVRVVAATNRDLRAEVVRGTFRKDLYYRLRVVPITVPPLRERVEDILPLAQHLLAKLGPELGRPEVTFGAKAVEAMQAYSWPGNVRELVNAVERALISANGNEIEPDHLMLDEELDRDLEDEAPLSSTVSGAPAVVQPRLPTGSIVLTPGQRNLAEVEALLIRKALEESGGQKSRAAEMLGINRTTLYNKLKDLIGEVVTDP